MCVRAHVSASVGVCMHVFCVPVCKCLYMSISSAVHMYTHHSVCLLFV